MKTLNVPRSSENCRQSARRHGTATLEFVFALPILMLLMVGMTWLGTSLLRQAQTSVNARHEAWSKRLDQSKSQAFVFSTNPQYRQSDDFESGVATKTISVSEVFAKSAAPASQQFVLSGNWDHQSLPLDSVPNWSTYRLSLENAATGDLQNLLGGIEQFQNAISDVGARLLAEQLGLSNALSGISSRANTGQQTQATQQQAQRLADKIRLQQREQELATDIANLEKKQILSGLTAAEQRRLFRLKSELTEIREELRELRSLGL